jgi:uncharacterized membrane protein
MYQAIFSWICHQLPGRSPCLDGCYFPVCYRCAGIYLGLATTLVFLLAFGRLRAALPSLSISLTISCLLLPICIDGWANTLGLWNSPAWLRYASGVMAGTSLPLIFLPLCWGVDQAEQDSPRSVRSIWELLVILFFSSLLLVPLEFAWGLSLWPFLKPMVTLGLLTLISISLSCLHLGWCSYRKKPSAVVD